MVGVHWEGLEEEILPWKTERLAAAGPGGGEGNKGCIVTGLDIGTLLITGPNTEEAG